MKNFTKDELALLEIVSNPVKWAETTLRMAGSKPVKLRKYQKDILLHKAIRKVTRMGRRTGKTFTMAVHILWYAFTHEYSKLVIVTPYENQITVIFDMIRMFIDNTQALGDSIEKNRQSPQYIKFKNGSTISGFTAGTKSGAEGGSVRGQAANWLYMDEVDYMSDADFETIYAITLEAPKRIGVWIASTPTGRRGKFWRACRSPKIWKEFYFPSMVNPEYGPEMEAEFRAMFTEVAYQHEVLAEFGEETIGVFKKEFIDRARSEYKYETTPLYKAPRIMGVDWDKYGAATQIVITEWDPNSTLTRHMTDTEGEVSLAYEDLEPKPRFRVIHRSEIPKSEFTLTNAVNRIVQLNNLFNVDHIYVDRGFGEFQVETLHRYGIEHPETGMDKKVKGISFAESREIRDPATKTVEKKPVKPFMVNQTALLLEKDQVILCEDDKHMWQQFVDYQVVKISNGGQPTYTSVNEHALDAFMLTIFGFQMEMPQLSEIIKPIQVARNIGFAQILRPDPLDALSETSIFNSKKKDEFIDRDGTTRLRKVPVGYKSKGRAKAAFDRGADKNFKGRESW